MGFSIQNYHYETHVEYYTDSDGKSQTREQTRRVDTHFAKHIFYAGNFVD